MRTLLAVGYALFVALMSSPALAQGKEEQLAIMGRVAKPTIRTLVMPTEPGQETPAIYVAGRVVTVLCFEREVDLAKTRLLEWEGRFEPLLIGSKKVVLEPLRTFDDAEVQPLLVTLVDGAEFAFVVKPASREDGQTVDHQVNVYKDEHSPDAMRHDLQAALDREAALNKEIEKLRKEEISVDHAFATLLANGEVNKTPFEHRETFHMTKANQSRADMGAVMEVFSYDEKAAVVVKLTNLKHEGPWRLDNVLVTPVADSSTPRPYALRMSQPQIARGQTGRIAIVVDKSAFADAKGKLTDLVLQLFSETGRQQVSVILLPALFQ